MSNLGDDLNSTISAAVTARVEAEILKALSGDEVLGQYVAAALNQPIEKDYGRVKTTWLRLTLRDAFREMVQAVVKAILEEERATIEDEIRKTLRRNAGDFAARITDGLVESATKGYGIRVEVQLPEWSG